MDHTLLKRWIASAGILLPLLLILREWALLPSMSAYWYSDARDVFTSSLAVVGGALGCYRRKDASGKNDPRDTRTSFIACAGAFCVVAFPMSPANAVGWLEIRGWLHFFAAVAFFGALAAMCLRLFPLSDQAVMGPQKLRRNAIYRACAYTIIAGIVALAVVANAFDHSPWVFWIEAVMVEAFGLAFAVKGGMIRALNDNP
jgi:hypothetical protein